MTFLKHVQYLWVFKFSTAVSLFALLACLILRQQAWAIPESQNFKFQYKGETIVLPLIPLGPDGESIPEYKESLEKMTSVEREEFLKDRSQKLLFYTKILSKVRFQRLINAVDWAEEKWSGPIDEESNRSRVMQKWDDTTKNLITKTLAAMDQHFWSGKLLEQNPNTRQAGLIIGFQHGFGVGPKKYLRLFAFGIGTDGVDPQTGRKRYQIISQSAKADPQSSLNFFMQLTPYVRFYMNRKANENSASSQELKGYSIATMVTRKSGPGFSNHQIGYEFNLITGGLFMGAGFAGMNGSPELASVLGSLWVAFSIPAKVSLTTMVGRWNEVREFLEPRSVTFLREKMSFVIHHVWMRTPPLQIAPLCSAVHLK